MSGTGPRDSDWGWPSASAWRTSSGPTSGSPARTAPTAPAAAGAASRSSSGASVLVVEDDRTARRALAALLRRQGFAVSEAGTVGDAVRALAGRPDWVLLDVMLPDGCGLDVFRRAG